MSLTPLTLPASRRLISLETLKGFLGITDSGSDEQLGQILDDVCAAIFTEWGRDARTDYEETLPGGWLRLRLSRWPVDEDSISVSTVSGTEVTGWRFHRPWTLYHSSGWPQPCRRMGEGDEENIVISYTAGYVLPDQVSDWSSTTPAAVGEWVRVAGLPLLAECTTAGTTGGTIPTWPERGDTVTDGSVVWTVRDAREVPAYARGWARIAAMAAWNALDRDPALLSRQADQLLESYSANAIAASTASLPAHVLRDIANRRLEAE